jgi:hypothetical protein
MPEHMRGGEMRDGGPALLWLAAPTAGRRRVGRAVLAEAALACRGWVEDLPGAVVLRGASPERARRLRDLLDRLMGCAVLVASPEPPPDLLGLDAWLDGLDPLLVAHRRTGWRLPAAAPGPDFLRLEIGRDAVAGLLGPLGADADLLDHALRRLQAALLRSLSDPARRRAAARAGPRRPRLHLRLPEGARSGAARPGRDGEAGRGGGPRRDRRPAAPRWPPAAPRSSSTGWTPRRWPWWNPPPYRPTCCASPGPRRWRDRAAAGGRRAHHPRRGGRSAAQRWARFQGIALIEAEAAPA